MWQPLLSQHCLTASLALGIVGMSGSMSSDQSASSSLLQTELKKDEELKKEEEELKKGGGNARLKLTMEMLAKAQAETQYLREQLDRWRGRAVQAEFELFGARVRIGKLEREREARGR